MKNLIQGVGVALITPFKADNSIDYDALGHLVESLISNGVDYLVPLGTTAETPTLSSEEKASIVSFIKEKNEGRLPLMIGAGGYCTSEVVKTIKKTDLNGIAAILSVTPYYNKPGQAGLFEHYKAIAGESPVPVLLYNVPSRTGCNMTAETTLKIAHEVENVLGVKEASGAIGQMSRILKDRPEGFRVISGDDGLTLPLLSIGGDGVISVAANAFPKQMVDMVRFANEGDYKSAAQIHMRLMDIIAALFEEGSPVGIKMAMYIMNNAENNLRLPLTPGTPQLESKLRRLIAELS